MSRLHAAARGLGVGAYYFPLLMAGWTEDRQPLGVMMEADDCDEAGAEAAPRRILPSSGLLTWQF